MVARGRPLNHQAYCYLSWIFSLCSLRCPMQCSAGGEYTRVRNTAYACSWLWSFYLILLLEHVHSQIVQCRSKLMGSRGFQRNHMWTWVGILFWYQYHLPPGRWLGWTSVVASLVHLEHFGKLHERHWASSSILLPFGNSDLGFSFLQPLQYFGTSSMFIWHWWQTLIG